jgi:hypothetical protein
MAVTDEAISQGSRLGEIGFAEFTASLVDSTLEAVLNMHARQTDMYIRLVNATARTLAQFIGSARDTFGEADVDGFVAGVGLTQTPAAGRTLSQAEADKLNNALAVPADAGIANNNRVAATTQIDANQLAAIRSAVRVRLAADQYATLREMVRQGMLRVVLDSGLIETRLSFRAYGRVSNSTRNSDRTVSTQSEVSANSPIVSAILGPRFRQNSSIAVSLADSSHRDVSGSSVSVFGRVELRFKTDFVPLNQ